ncbi:MAG: sugar transferase [Acidobacteriota bacterium]|nr:sugar transferase [Acidobacteriota bacterium]
MQPERITVQKALSQRAETNYKQSSSQLSSVHTPFHDNATGFSHRDFVVGDFANDDFGDLATMAYALPDVIEPRVFRILGASLNNGHMSARARSVYEIGKRGLDITAALTLLLLASPLLLVIALVVKATSNGPVFFAHRRLGQNGRMFGCLKFRTMIANAEERLQQDSELRRQFEEKFKLEDDPRITSVGNFLRRTSLDELPQLLHVLRGEMSLVGPRPIVESELTKYSIYANKLLSVKPGLSGLWQVCGRSHTTYPQRVMMDMHYIDHRSFALDLQLLLLTASAVVRKSGAW